MPERVLVAGCGAVGSVFACLLAERGHMVDVLGRGRHLMAVAADGIRVQGIWGEHHGRPVRSVEQASDLTGTYDAILVTCKSFQTSALVRQLGVGRVRDDGVAISLQNGLGNWEVIAATFGSRRSLAARVIFGAEIAAPGMVSVTVEAEPVLVGHPSETQPQAAAWAGIFSRAGIASRPTDSILAALWGKVFYNAALNPMGALLGLRYGELAEDPLRRRVMDRVIEEAFAVAVAQGVTMPWRDAGEYKSLFYEKLVPATARHRSSMLQDLERGRTTEIDAICGEVCRRADMAGIDVPTHRLLLALLRGRAAA
ncbi:MAG TPA: 2-dehydropantoate 2-reductase [Candidatus Limnocylindrales bacterium]|nr:2-dehydropantoate 2-reductase [Candidatus Limnocylindrales bacterium]